MTRRSFSLLPFPASNIPDIVIKGNISRQINLLTLHYSLTGNIGDILLPPPLVYPGRKDGLWKTTCFEFFLAIKGQSQYWEFNMSPSGDWNIYCMDAYRRSGFREETSIQQLQLEAQNEAGIFTLNVTVDLSPIIQQTQPVEIGITAVMQTKNGKETYWALVHPAPQPDFHLRESFILALAGQTRPAPKSAPES